MGYNQHPYDITMRYHRTVHGTDPAAGASYQFAFPTRRVVMLQAFSFLLTTDANVANRYPNLLFFTGANLPFRAYTDRQLPASQTMRYTYGFNYGTSFISTAVPNKWNVPIPGECVMGSDATIRIEVDNVQVGDQISEIYFSYVSWFDTPSIAIMP